MKAGGSVVKNAVRAAVAARVHCRVANSPRSKACAAFDLAECE